MTDTKPRSYPHAVAIKDALEDADLTVGDHGAPKNASGNVITPCVVFRMEPSAPPMSSVGKDGTDVLLRFRLTAYDLTADGAQFYADKVFDAMDGAELLVEDRAIFRVRRVNVAGVDRDMDVTPNVFYCPTPYSLLSVSAPEESS